MPRLASGFLPTKRLLVMNTSSREAFLSGSVIRSLVARLELSLVLAFCPGRRSTPVNRRRQVRSCPPRAGTTYEQRVLPFLKQHCWKCHDEDSAKAGFRVDELGTDFLAGKTADRWREAIDQINLGKMPKKKDQTRPEGSVRRRRMGQSGAAQRRETAQSAGGRAPMRRLNRTEYANTVRDLFHLDEHFARKIEQELPADGKVDGFDRGGAALFFDKSQFQAYLDAADLVVREALPAEPIKANKFRVLALEDSELARRSPTKTTTMEEVLNRGDIKFADSAGERETPLARCRARAGAVRPECPARRRRRNRRRLALRRALGGGQTGQILQKVIKRDGWYRFRIRAGASRGTGKFAVDAVRIQADYCPQSRELRRRFDVHHRCAAGQAPGLRADRIPPPRRRGVQSRPAVRLEHLSPLARLPR